MIGGNQPHRRTTRTTARLVAVVVLAAAGAGCVDLADDGVETADPEPLTTLVTTSTAATSTSTSTSAPPAVTTTVAATTTTFVIPEGDLDDIPPVPTEPATALVDRLVVAEPHEPTPYRHKAFGGDWDYDPVSGCNTRERVLAQESGPGLVVDDRCKPLTGTWISAYDGLTTNDPADLEVDHLVALAEAWRTGAADWTEDRRRAFYNDLDDPATLQAVSSRSNRSKQDSPPDRWLPEAHDARCAYVGDWVRVKHRWSLTVSPAEKVAIVQVLGGC